MAVDLSALGLVPPDEHPDAQLFVLLAKQKVRHDEWKAARGDAACRRLLAKWRRDCPIRQEELIARFTPSTLEGLIEKADAALHEWREDDGDDRYKRMWASMATALEQAMQVIQAQRLVEMPAIGRQGT